MFWRLAPVEVHAILDGYHERLKQQHESEIHQAHYLAHLVRFAFHDPNNMPEPTGPKPKQAEVARDVDHARVSAFFQSMATKEKS